MKIDTYICEECGKRSDDMYACGWIRLEGSISRGHGRDENNRAVSDYLSSSSPHDPHTFCSLACLEKKLDAIAEKAGRQVVVTNIAKRSRAK